MCELAVDGNSAEAQSEADRCCRQPLHQDNPHQTPITDTQRFENGELAEVLDDEAIERLTDKSAPGNKGKDQGDQKVLRDGGAAKIMAHRSPHELLAGQRLQAGVLFDASA